MKNFVISLLSLVLSSTTALGQNHPEIRLWDKVAPGSEGKTGAEKVRISEGGDHVVSGIHTPSITPFLPAAGKSTRAAIVIAPGGGHRELWIDHEGYNPGQWFSENGIAVFVLKYRLAREEGSTYSVDEHSLADIKRAIRTIKSRAMEWDIDTAKVGVMGFSAGGELAALAAMHYDNGNPSSSDPVERMSSRPTFQALIYPGGAAGYEVKKGMPPAFFVAGYNDRPDISEGLAQLYLRYKQAGIPADLHIYATAGHGFGIRASNLGASAAWPQQLLQWLVDTGVVKK
jgi:acetyl esterase/lipase